MRDATVGDTLYFLFTTRSFSTGAPATLGGTPVLSVYEENNLTQITAGVSVSADYDSVTGLNQATIVASGANGYESGKSYSVVITTGTVGGVSVVGEVVAEFTLEASSAFTRLGAPAGASVSADIATIDSNVDAILVDTGTTLPATLATAQADLDTITGADGATLATTQSAITWAAQTISVSDGSANITLAGAGSGDALAFTRSGAGNLKDAAWIADEASNTRSAVGMASANLDTQLTAIVGDTNELQADWANGGRLDLIIDAIKAVTDLIPNGGALNDISAADVNTQVLDVLNTDTFAEIGAIPAATTTLTNMIRLLYSLARNKTTQTATTFTLRNDGDTGSIGTATVSDDGTTATKGKIA